MKAMIIDGEELFRMALRQVISVAGTFSTIIEVSNNRSFLSQSANCTSLDLIVIHPGSLRGDDTDALALARRLYPNAKIVAVADSDTVHKPTGVDTVISRRAPVSDMIRTLRHALGIKASIANVHPAPTTSSELNTAIQKEFKQFRNNLQHATDDAPTKIDLGRLSFRQRQILTMAADGLPNKEIAARLGIAEGTVKAHMHAIFKVLGVSNRTQAVIRYGASGQRVNKTTPDVHTPANAWGGMVPA